MPDKKFAINRDRGFNYFYGNRDEGEALNDEQLNKFFHQYILSNNG